MKKLISIMLAMSLMASLVACGSDTSSSSSNSGNSNQTTGSDPNTDNTNNDTLKSNALNVPTGTTVVFESDEDASGQLVIGSTTDANADMLTGWTNAAPNAQVKALIHGAGTVAFTAEGTFEPNYAVLAEELQTTDNDDGSKTFTMTIKEDLVYSDGSAITAQDYVFAVLLTSSPEFGDIDADNFTGIQYVGFEDFNDGSSKTFSGVNLIDDYTFSVTVKAEELPFYYDITLASVTPYPMAVIAPDVTITDDGSGATISDNFTAELLAVTINDPATGYRYNPQVTAGSYQFVSYNASSYEIVIKTNPNFAGTYDGVFPAIETLIFKSVVNATQFDDLAAGSVDLLSGISGGDSINTGLDLVDTGSVAYTSYPRSGYGKIAFATNHGPTQFQTVRQAIAYTLDREEFAREYTGGFGQLTHGYYSLSQWEFLDNQAELNTQLNQYTKNLEIAEQILIDDGWTLNASGGEYVKGVDDVRHKMVDGSLMALEIEWANSPNNPVSDLIAIKLPDAFAEVGMKLNSNTIEFAVLLENLYQNGGLQNYHMYNLATSFATTSAVWYYFNKDIDTYGGTYNQTFIVDEELHEIAQFMKTIDSGDTETWSAKWLELQIRWNELLPELPLYSDEYHEFFSAKLTDYTPNALWDVRYAVVYASVSE